MEAAHFLEEAYSLFILFIYAVTIPVLCFDLFTILRGQGIDLLGALVLSFWGFDIIFILFFVSIPAILLHEQVNFKNFLLPYRIFFYSRVKNF